MKLNMGFPDRVIRFIIALAIAIIIFTGQVSGTWMYVLVIAGAIMLLTSIVGLCPLYSLLGIRTFSTKTPAK